MVDLFPVSPETFAQILGEHEGLDCSGEIAGPPLVLRQRLPQPGGGCRLIAHVEGELALVPARVDGVRELTAEGEQGWPVSFARAWSITGSRPSRP